ncbi:MAG: response regulator [Syntrophorhabdaceae bacterium]|nr:response regulator [Syntrophorhabdaceae bacterium]
MADEDKSKEELIAELNFLRQKYRELTEREQSQKQLGEALIRAKQEWEQTFDSLPELIAILDTQQKIVRVNKTMANKLGMKPQELIGKECCIFFQHDHETLPISCPHLMLLQDGNPHKVELYIEPLKAIYEITALPFYDKSGQLIGSIHIASDVTERREAEEKIRKSEEKYRNIFENAIVGFFQSTPEGRFLSVNPAFAKMHGFDSPEEMIRSISNIAEEQYVNPEDRKRLINSYREKGYVENFEIELFRKDRRKIWVSINSRAVYDKDGNVLFYEGTAVDITERKAAEERLKKAKEDAEVANRTKSEFLAGISHEIRTPMNAIIGMAELLLETPLSAEQQKYVTILRDAGENLLRLINDLLDLSKAEEGKIELESIDFDLTTVIESVFDVVKGPASKKNLELWYRVAPDVPTLLVGDPARLRQVLLNLVGNSVKFTERGEVTLEVRVGERPENREEVVLSFIVKDTGIGIPEDKLDTIFEKFTQVDSSTTRKYGGTGLGLTITKKIIKLMGGDIRVKSKIGEGTTMSFYARFGLKKGKREEYAKLDTPSLKGIKALIIDDNSTNRIILGEMLSPLGISYIEEKDGIEAIGTLERHAMSGSPFNLVLLDYQMPHTDGLQVAELIKKNDTIKEVPIIMLTSGQLEGGIKKAQEAGISHLIEKPVKKGELKEAIETALGHLKEKGVYPPVQTVEIPYKERPLKILIAEDNEDNRMLLWAYFKNTPHIIHLAENGAIALEKFKNNMGEFDLVFMDMQMPVMDGYTATSMMRKWEEENGLERTPIVALTAHAMKEDAEKSLKAGCDGHITKPIKKAQLFDAIRTYARVKKDKNGGT